MPKIEPPAPPYIGPPSWHGSKTNRPINRIVMHCTVGQEPGVKGAARATVAMSKRTSRPSSYHYIVDSAETLQYVYDSWVAYHAPPNQRSIGVELCCSLANEGRDHWQRADHQAMLKRAAALVAQLCLAYDVPITGLSAAELRAGKRGICGHHDVTLAWHQTTHTDPERYFPWGQFLGLVRAEADRLRRTPPPKPKPQPKPVPKDLFTAGHQSGYWGASDESWTAGILALRKAGARVITLTETGIDRRMPLITPPGWDLARIDEKPGQSECSIMWNRKFWRAASDPYVTLLSDTTWRRAVSGHRTQPIWGLTQPLQHVKSGRVVLLGALHSPSAVDGRDGYNEDAPLRVKAHRETVANVDQMWTIGRERHVKDKYARLLNADWNLDARKQWVADWWDAEQPSLTSVWEKHLANRGTHGDRVIDWLALGGRLELEDSEVLPPTPGLDHKGVVARIGWKVPRP